MASGSPSQASVGDSRPTASGSPSQASTPHLAPTQFLLDSRSPVIGCPADSVVTPKTKCRVSVRPAPVSHRAHSLSVSPSSLWLPTANTRVVRHGLSDSNFRALSLAHRTHPRTLTKGVYPSGLRARVLTLTLTLTLTLAMFSNPKGMLKMYMRVRAYATAAHSGSYPNH